MNTTKTMNNPAQTTAPCAMSLRARIGRTAFFQQWHDAIDTTWHNVLLLAMAFAVLAAVVVIALPLIPHTFPSITMDLPAVFYNGTTDGIAYGVAAVCLAYGYSIIMVHRLCTISSQSRYDCEDIYVLISPLVDNPYSARPATREQWHNYFSHASSYFFDYREYTSFKYKAYKLRYNLCRSAMAKARHIDDDDIASNL